MQREIVSTIWEIKMKRHMFQVRTLQCTKPYNSRNRHSVSNGSGSWGPLNPQIRAYYIGNCTVCRRIQIQGMPSVPGGWLLNDWSERTGRFEGVWHMIALLGSFQTSLKT